jgi:hypothetical protein
MATALKLPAIELARVEVVPRHRMHRIRPSGASLLVHSECLGLTPETTPFRAMRKPGLLVLPRRWRGACLCKGAHESREDNASLAQ